MGKYDIGFDEYLAKIETVQKNAPGFIIDELNKEGRQLRSAYRKMVRSEARLGTGKKHLHLGMTIQDVKKISGVYSVALYNDYKKAPHFHLVEHGHRKVSRKGVDLGGKVAGRKYFERSFKQVEKRLTRQRMRFAVKMFEKLR